MASGHVAFVSFPGYGHIRPTLAIVDELLARGHRVTYLVADRFADDVADTGADVVTYHSSFPEPVPSPPDLVRMTIEFIRESFAPLRPALARFDPDPPDLIVHDALVSDTAGILSRKYGVPTVRTFPGFGGNEQVPLNGAETRPGEQALDPNDPLLVRFGSELTDSLRALDMELLAGQQLAAGANPAHNLVFVPAAFQPMVDAFDDRFTFVGPCLRRSELNAEWTPPDAAKPLALVTLGTSANQSPEFFRTCARAFESVPWQVVMTLGRSMDPAVLGALPANVTAVNWVPHLAVLRHASVFVCQAGSGSLMESLYRGTPVVVVPRSPDSFALAERVVELGVGRMLDADRLTADQLVHTVLAVAADPSIKARVAELRRAVRAAGGASRAADELESRLRRTVSVAG
ncbi:MAG TPA: macrolide family glycosyltransferase [Pseudonocardiaceae bacterium]|jgi:MGT family glycosyltransferase|nr:macrolide family glycosyltransferase [Pseudonocardiaceae bacterium]